MIEAIARTTIIRSYILKNNNKSIVTYNTTSYISKPDPFVGENSISEAVAEALIIKANMQKRNNNNNANKDYTTSYILKPSQLRG